MTAILSWALLRNIGGKVSAMRRIFWVMSLGAIGAIGGLGGWQLAAPGTRGGGPVIPRLRLYGHAPSFELTDQIGRTVSSKVFSGKVRVVSFLFPYCTEYCPYIAKWMVDTGRLLDREGWANRVQLVSFDVDPAHTTPEVLRPFMRQYGWKPADSRWEFLTGSRQAIRRVVTGGYHISYQRVVGHGDNGADSDPGLNGYNPLARRVRPGYDVEHNDSVIIVDRKGRIRAVISRAYRLEPRQVVSLIRKAWSSS